MTVLRFLVAWFALLQRPHFGLATTFDVPELDPWNPSPEFACHRPRGVHRPLFKAGRFVASSTLPCWTLLYVCTQRRCALATVGDYLPPKSYRFDDDLDLWRKFARRIGAHGWERVVFWRLTGGNS